MFNFAFSVICAKDRSKKVVFVCESPLTQRDFEVFNSVLKSYCFLINLNIAKLLRYINEWRFASWFIY